MKEKKVNLTEKKSVLEDASWWSFLNFTWTFNLIEKARTAKLTKEDLGGLRECDTFEANSKNLIEIF